MSEARAPSASDIEARAALWIDRRDRGEWTAEDQAELDSWLAQSMAHSIAFWRLNAAWQRTERLAAFGPREEKAVRFFNRAKMKPALLRAAAGIAAAVLIGASGFYWLHPSARAYETTSGTREILSLSDGSQIELNTDTALRVSRKAGERVVWLDRGEAFFQIKHDPAHPFVVNVAGKRVVDLGTKFSIRTDPQRTEISLTEGRARLEAKISAQKEKFVMLRPGDVAVATAAGVSVTKRPLRVLNNRLGWLRGVLIFDNTRLADAAAQFNRYSQHRLAVDGAVADLRIDGTFQANDPAAFAAIIEHILHLHARDEGNQIVITR